MSAIPMVSVVIPAYNAEATVRVALESALRQTREDIEVIVVDDGSSDGTGAEVEAVADERVTLVKQPNGGASAARNAGIERAAGSYVALLDADDIWLPSKLDRQLAFLEKRSNCAAVQSGAYFVNGALDLMNVRPCAPVVDPLLESLRFQNLPAFPSSLLIERRKLDSIGHFDTSLIILEDWDMAIKAAWHCNLQAVTEPLVLYRVHFGNRSRDLDIHIEPGFRVLERLFRNPELPPHVKSAQREIYARFYTMLAGGALKVRNWQDASRWGLKALRTDPRTFGYMAALPTRRFRRRISRTAPASPEFTAAVELGRASAS